MSDPNIGMKNKFRVRVYVLEKDSFKRVLITAYSISTIYPKGIHLKIYITF